MSVSRFSSALLLSTLLLSTGSLNAQKPPRSVDNAVRLPDAPSSITQLPKSARQFGIFFPDAHSFTSSLNQGPGGWFNALSSSQSTWSPFYLSLATRDALMAPFGGTFYFDAIGNGRRPTSLRPASDFSQHDWQYYSHHIPWAGPIAIRVGQQAKAHPRVTNVLKVVQPQF